MEFKMTSSILSTSVEKWLVGLIVLSLKHNALSFHLHRIKNAITQKVFFMGKEKIDLT